MLSLWKHLCFPHEALQRHPPRAGFQSQAVLAEERRLPQVKLRRSQLRYSTVQLENCCMQHTPRLENLSEL